MTDMFDVAGRSILIAGGAGGIGSGIAAELARRGAKITIADLNEEDPPLPTRRGKDILELHLGSQTRGRSRKHTPRDRTGSG